MVPPPTGNVRILIDSISSKQARSQTYAPEVRNCKILLLNAHPVGDVQLQKGYARRLSDADEVGG
jgi:hypothetical protein